MAGPSDPAHDGTSVQGPSDGELREVDARGLACPMPVIELARAVAQIDIGTRVRLLATDPAATVDVPVWCRMQRHRLHDRYEADGVTAFVVERLR